MNLKNYTSSVPAANSMARIEKCLVEVGATDINKKYVEGICTAISFRIMITGRPMFFQLPARVDACFKVLWKEVKRPGANTKQNIQQQSERTAWKLISDWVEVQIAMIQLEQAETMQVFLPYVYDPQREQTYYEHLKETGFKLLN